MSRVEGKQQRAGLKPSEGASKEMSPCPDPKVKAGSSYTARTHMAVSRGPPSRSQDLGWRDQLHQPFSPSSTQLSALPVLPVPNPAGNQGTQGSLMPFPRGQRAEWRKVDCGVGRSNRMSYTDVSSVALIPQLLYTKCLQAFHLGSRICLSQRMNYK